MYKKERQKKILNKITKIILFNKIFDQMDKTIFTYMYIIIDINIFICVYMLLQV